jgi:hypothetical protein
MSSTILGVESSALQDANYDKLVDEFIGKKSGAKFVNILRAFQIPVTFSFN